VPTKRQVDFNRELDRSHVDGKTLALHLSLFLPTHLQCRLLAPSVTALAYTAFPELRAHRPYHRFDWRLEQVDNMDVRLIVGLVVVLLQARSLRA
jgi:hypothetical protein